MIKVNFSKYSYEEYFINDTKLKKLYNMYVHKHLLEKILNILVLFAMILTTMGFILSYFNNINTSVLTIVNSFSIFVLCIFILELIKDYAESKNRKDFFKHYWIDFLLIMFLSIYFVFLGLIYITQLLFLDQLKPVIHYLKEFRITYKLFKFKK